MAAAVADPRMRLVADLTAACSAEIGSLDPAASIPWPTFPTVAAMVGHLGGVHRWVTEVVRTQQPAAEGEPPDLPVGAWKAWFDEGRAALLEVLAAVPAETPCWILGNRRGTAAFWRRRMVVENAKHLIDLRASGGRDWAAAPELTPGDYADGIDELLAEFLPRSRPALPPLPGGVELRATDSGRTWRIGPDWATGGAAAAAGEPAAIVARTADLALLLWERADPLQPDGRFRIEGSRRTVAALRSTSIHPW